jgi:hypothetical protein
VVEGEGPEFKPQYNKNKTKHTKKGRLKTQKPLRIKPTDLHYT